MEQENNTQTQNPNNNAYKIMRRSIHTFLTHFHHFTSTPALLALPFSLSLLLLHPSAAATTTLHRRLHAVLLAAGFPLNSPSSHLFLLKLSQTLASSFSSLPFSLSFLLLSKSATIQSFRRRQPTNAAFFHLLTTQICNLFILIGANSACLSLLCLASALIGALPAWAYAAGAVFYSVIVANAVVVCNLALISSVWEESGGLSAIVRAFVLIRGKRTVTALALALPANLAMAGAEAVFRYRIYGGGSGEERWILGVAAEMVLIACVYSVLIVGDTIVGCLFYQSCKEELGWCSNEDEIEDEGDYYPSDLNKLRALEEGLSW